MKTSNKMKTMKQFRILPVAAILLTGITLGSCSSDDDAPAEENEVEVITSVTLTFTSDTETVTATAIDADGAGIGELEVQGSIDLAVDTEYTLTYEILNALDPTDVENIELEIEEENDEHQFFYSFTEDAFADPMGDGNIDEASDAVDYVDFDANGNPVGLTTTWLTSADGVTEGSFRTRLQHQPDLKSATTGSADGDTDIDLTFTLNIE